MQYYHNEISLVGSPRHLICLVLAAWSVHNAARLQGLTSISSAGLRGFVHAAQIVIADTVAPYAAWHDLTTAGASNMQEWDARDSQDLDRELQVGSSSQV